MSEPKPFILQSLDLSAVAQHMRVEDPLAFVLRAHLYVEAMLIRQIESSLVNKQHFDSARLPFLTKVNLAVALGKIDPIHAGAFSVLNRLRVRFAHDLNTELREQDELDLYNALSGGQRRLVDRHRKPEMPLMERLRRDMAVLIVAAGVEPGKVADDGSYSRLYEE